ncbi:MAG: arginine--tRNA ligase [Eubacterium sp.]|nr:arginine--tRNA ligase [Eubacterium sp.]
MKTILERLNDIAGTAFEKAGYDPKYGQVKVSDRPDLCQYQCNGAMAAAKQYHKAPIQIANDVVEGMTIYDAFESVEAVNPGFININLNPEFLAEVVQAMSEDERLGVPVPEHPKMILVDYGGANVAKPLHVGHLRPATIGESVKRICAFAGHKVIGDVHLGDWGLQIGLIITELKKRQPELPYFDESFSGEYPKEAPFTISDLEEIYPTASARSKEDEAFRTEAEENTRKLQSGYEPYMAIWRHIMEISVADLKKNYDRLDVHFDLWKGESDVESYIPDMIEELKKKGLAYESEGALVVDVTEEGDAKELPPCIILKSNGATLYATTDLATIIEREKLYQPDQIIYVADKRQSLHFTQVFRVAKKAALIDEEAELIHIGFGTMNGPDGTPFKTRDGGILRLEDLHGQIVAEVRQKMSENRDYEEQELGEIADKVGLAALKYGDLSNQASKDYIFDVARFASFEGNTGPYILYTIVRIGSVLAKFADEGGKVDEDEPLMPPASESESELYRTLTGFPMMVEGAYRELAPHKVCQYIYSLSEAFNHFYHETKILAESDEDRKNSYLRLITLVRRVLEKGIDLLGFEAPEKM